jgi:hypothetical protein
MASKRQDNRYLPNQERQGHFYFLAVNCPYPSTFFDNFDPIGPHFCLPDKEHDSCRVAQP